LAGEINTGMPDYVINRLILALNDRGKALRGRQGGARQDHQGLTLILARIRPRDASDTWEIRRFWPGFRVTQPPEH